LLQEAAGIGYFVDHPEGVDESDDLIDADRVGLAEVYANAADDAGLAGAPFEDAEHLRSYVDGDHTARLAEQPGQAYGVEPHAAADVEHGHARLHVGAEQLVGVVEQPAQHVVERVGVPPGACVG